MAKKPTTKSRVKYVCSACGYESPAFLGRCPECDAWGTLVETVTLPEAPVGVVARGGGIRGVAGRDAATGTARGDFARGLPAHAAGDGRGEPRARRWPRARLARARRRRSRYRQIHAAAASRGATERRSRARSLRLGGGIAAADQTARGAAGGLAGGALRHRRDGYRDDPRARGGAATAASSWWTRSRRSRSMASPQLPGA